LAGTDQRRVGRPPKAVLDRARIGDAALALVDESGDFTLPGLARRLGVQASSLYHHVSGRAGVVELLRERITLEIDTGQLDKRPWDVALTGLFRSYRAAYAHHPRVVPLLMTTPVRAPEVLVAYDKVAALLAEMGVPARRTMAFLTACESFIIGSALDLAAPEVMWEIPEDVEAPRLVAALTARDSTGRRADDAFEYGLAALLATLSTYPE
jgi:AcrR family transcriptional regulator